MSLPISALHGFTSSKLKRKKNSPHQKTPSPGAASVLWRCRPACGGRRGMFSAPRLLMICNFSRKQFEGQPVAASEVTAAVQEHHGSSDFISRQGCKLQQQAGKILFFSKHHSDYWLLISLKFYIFVTVMWKKGCTDATYRIYLRLWLHHCLHHICFFPYLALMETICAGGRVWHWRPHFIWWLHAAKIQNFLFFYIFFLQKKQYGNNRWNEKNSSPLI